MRKIIFGFIIICIFGLASCYNYEIPPSEEDYVLLAAHLNYIKQQFTSAESESEEIDPLLPNDGKWIKVDGAYWTEGAVFDSDERANVLGQFLYRKEGYVTDDFKVVDYVYENVTAQDYAKRNKDKVMKGYIQACGYFDTFAATGIIINTTYRTITILSYYYDEQEKIIFSAAEVPYKLPDDVNIIL